MNGKKKPGVKDERPTEDLTETDFADEIMGDNALQGDDQARVRNERRAVPGVKKEADKNLQETFEKSDKDVRAKREMGKGGRHSPKHKFNSNGEG